MISSSFSASLSTSGSIYPLGYSLPSMVRLYASRIDDRVNDSNELFGWSEFINSLMGECLVGTNLVQSNEMRFLPLMASINAVRISS